MGETGGKLADLTDNAMNDPDIPFVQLNLIEKAPGHSREIGGIVVVRFEVYGFQGFKKVI